MKNLDVEFYSFNTRGLGIGKEAEIKRKIIFNHLKKKSDKGIFFLQETHTTEASEKLWKRDWPGKIFFEHYKSDSRGCAMLVSPNIDYEFTELPTNDKGRSQYVKMHYSEDEYLLLCNLYAPTRNHVLEQIEFLNKCKLFIEGMDCVDFLLGGDFNTVFDPTLDKQGGDMINCVNQYTSSLINFMEAFDLVDVIRLMYPDKKIFTRFQRTPLVLSRIDHWLLSNHLCNYITSAKVYPGVKSDHSIINVHLCTSNDNRGRGFWKFNALLLQDQEYIKKVKELVPKLEADLIDMEDKGLKWDCIKCDIRSMTLSYSISMSKKRKEKVKKLTTKLLDLQHKLSESANCDTLCDYENVKGELEQIEQQEVKGAMLRSKIKWAEAGEKNSKYFLNLEKRNAINKTIIRLEQEDGQVIEGKNPILTKCKEYFKNVYTETYNDRNPNSGDQFFIKEHETLSNEQQEFCEGLLTFDECTKAVSEMKNGKSPGTDGFTVEFYKFFWSSIGKLVLDSLNYAYKKGELSIDQRRGIITLIPKTGKKRILLKNWRPISLLNTDYKILTKSLASRLKKVLPSIIDPDQTGFIEGRYIGENIRTISDLIDFTSLRDSPGIILLIDFEKAFDTIRWSYITKCLKYFNFGDSFIHWIHVIYNNIESTVINNGHTSDSFSISRGIRQGCPISPYLFIIAVEVLAISIRANKGIKGIKVGSTEFKISQLADDTTLFLLDLLSVKNALKLLKNFYNISGLRINMDKTYGKGIGSLTGLTPGEDMGIKWTTGPITTLGVTISNDPIIISKSNFDSRIQVMTDILNIWLTRNLSLNGKVTILKSLALPIVQYPASCLPITFEITKSIETQISKFLWKHKTPKVKHSTIIQSIEDGGIKAPDFKSIVKANRISWVKRILTSKGKWTCILENLIAPLSLEHFFETHLTDDIISSIQIPFYRQILKTWNETKCLPSNAAQYSMEILWENKLIQAPSKIQKNKSKIKTENLWQPKMYKAGVVRIKDLLNDDGTPMHYNVFITKFNITINVLIYYRIIKALPTDWINEIQSFLGNHNNFQNTLDSHCMSLPTSNGMVNVYKASTKVTYNCLVRLKYNVPTALSKWDNFITDFNDWNNIFKLPYSCCRETYLQAFQYRIIHRFLPCNKWLNDVCLKDSNQCNICSSIDTIEHFLYGCKSTKQFWNQLELWWNDISISPVVLTVKHVIFGYYYDLSFYSCINFIIMVGKMYIYRCKLNDKNVLFNCFLQELKGKLEIEKAICESNKTSSQFQKKWSLILQNL